MSVIEPFFCLVFFLSQGIVSLKIAIPVGARRLLRSQRGKKAVSDVAVDRSAW
jgi:hypothetical protein